MGHLGIRRGRSPARTRAVVTGALVVCLLTSAVLYVAIGWRGMESACLSNDTGESDSVAYGWSWQPLGFQCTFGNGSTRTSLWF